MNKKHKSSIKKFIRHPLSIAISLSLTGGLANATVMNVSGACTIINAINNANANADIDGKGGCPAGKHPDIINLAAGKIYTLTTVNNTTDGTNGLPSITSNITINGNGATLQRSVISGTPRFRLLHIGASGNLTINKLKLQNGLTGLNGDFAPSFPGGAIFNRGKLRLIDSAISRNDTYINYYVFGGSGGGIFNAEAANLTLTHSIVSNNRSSTGAGIDNHGALSLVDSTVSGNSTLFQCGGYFYSAVCGGSGGGIANDAGSLAITRSSISNNTSLSSGGGISNSKGNLTLVDSLVSKNSSEHGGGISNSGGTLTMIKSIVASNKAQQNCNSVHSFLSCDEAQGGGIFNGVDSLAKVINSNIMLNTASVHPSFYGNDSGTLGGGGFFNSGVARLTNTTVWNNQAKGEYDFQRGGGGLYNTGNLTLTHSTVSRNETENNIGGGLNNTGSLTLRNSLIANSISGGDCLSSGRVTLRGVNLIEDGSCGAPLSGDPKLNGIVNNGGLTLTQALLPGSPVVDAAATPFCIGFDQRGVNRPQPAAGKCDIGAFERIPSVPPSVATIVEFFDTNVASGGIVGTGTSAQAILRRDGFRNQLLTGGNFKDRNLTTQACNQLARSVKRIDPDNSPKTSDYVTGNAADALATEVIALRSEWDCPE
jgi:hypothetical protein